MKTTDENMLRYDRMVEYAMRGVVRQAVTEVQKTGELPGDHHFYITFLTDFPGVQIPEYLHERYPGEMTIVLQYQFENLTIDAEKMGVSLSFNNVKESLVIPLAAITIFADPSVNFALQFQPIGDILAPEDGEEPDDDGSPGGKDRKKPKTPPAADQKTGEVVSLDQFRKK